MVRSPTGSLYLFFTHSDKEIPPRGGFSLFMLGVFRASQAVHLDPRLQSSAQAGFQVDDSQEFRSKGEGHGVQTTANRRSTQDRYHHHQCE
jgi:hypothetical protein